MQYVTAILCAILSVFGFKSLHLFAASNGLVGRLESQISKRATPAGKPLLTWDTGGRFPLIDLQINAVASFQLIFCETISRLDVNIIGFWFAASWGPSWILIVLESLREYSQSRLMSWITIPGIFIYNQSHAVFTSLYLAIRLAVAAPATTRESLMIDTIHLRAMPWSFLLTNVLPLSIMAMPGLSVSEFNTKHIAASLYQQWNLYISLFHLLLIKWWTHNGTTDTPGHKDSTSILSDLRPVYNLAFAMAVASVWLPVLFFFAVHAFQRIRKSPASRNTSLRPASILLPPSPWSKIKCRDAFEGGKWLLQWDGIIGGLSTAIWAISLYAQARIVAEPTESLGSFILRVMWYMILGGPIGVATGALWERDMLVLQ